MIRLNWTKCFLKFLERRSYRQLAVMIALAWYVGIVVFVVFNYNSPTRENEVNSRGLPVTILPNPLEVTTRRSYISAGQLLADMRRKEKDVVKLLERNNNLHTNDDIVPRLPTTNHNFSFSKETVSDSRDDSSSESGEGMSGFAVPKIVHFVWFASNRSFSFLNALAVISAAKYIQPTHIYFHTDREPGGKWWQLVRNNVSSAVLRVVSRTRPRYVWGVPIVHYEHAADVARLQILIAQGGIYLDIDVISLKSFDPLRHYDCVLDVETRGYALANGIIVARSKAKFLRLWYDAYRTFDPSGWGNHSVMMAWRLYSIFPSLVHLEEGRLVGPAWDHAYLQFLDHWDWSRSYSVHIWDRFGHVPSDVDEVKVTDNMVGEVMRHVYFGTAALLGRRNETLSRGLFFEKFLSAFPVYNAQYRKRFNISLTEVFAGRSVGQNLTVSIQTDYYISSHLNSTTRDES